MSKLIVGKIYQSKFYGDFEVLEHKGYLKCKIRFINTGAVVENISKQHILTGSVKDPLVKTIQGVGFFGISKYKSREKDGTKSKYYNTWKHMINRCYNSNENSRNYSYETCEVDSYWHNFQNFAEWMESNYNPETMQGWHLDKDILVKGNKIYSPDTCAFVPPEINMVIAKTEGKYTGVSKRGNKWIARLNMLEKRVSLGHFKTEEEAIQSYKTAKEQYIKEVADKWSGLIEDKVYKAMINYKL